MSIKVEFAITVALAVPDLSSWEQGILDINATEKYRDSNFDQYYANFDLQTFHEILFNHNKKKTVSNAIEITKRFGQRGRIEKAAEQKLQKGENLV